MQASQILSFGKKVCSLALAFSIVLMLSGIPAPARTCILYVFLGIWPLVMAIVTWARMRVAKDPVVLGRALIHGGWIWASLGLGSLLLTVSPYFAGGVPLYSVVLSLLMSILLLILGLYALIWSNKRTGVPISI